MITILESQGIMPIPVFISGVEGHTVVRGVFALNFYYMSGGLSIIIFLSSILRN